jgi:hypothetical protein
MERKIKIKISYFIRERKTETPTIRQHDKLTRNLEKTSKHKSRETVQERTHQKLALTQNVSPPRIL